MTTSSTDTASVFQGNERLELFEPLGRPMRKASPSALAVSDIDRVRQALSARDGDAAKGYVQLLKPLYDGMILSYTEWAYALPNAVSRRVPPAAERAVTVEACALWRQVVTQEKEFKDHAATVHLLELLVPEKLLPAAIVEFRQNVLGGKPTPADDIGQTPGRLYTETIEAIDAGDYPRASRSFEEYLSEIRCRHDLLVEFVSLYPLIVTKKHGQEISDATMHESFASGVVYAGLWQLVKALDPVEVAAFLAEHLRAHFSGKNREGSVEIVEEPDRYRLIFAPCGSGGAMRQRALQLSPEGAGTLPEASVHTWGRKGEVPSYCSHCAVNELESMDRIGYPLFVTEFDPDPTKPCGWSFYKDPSLVPERYFTRLGHKKDPSKFQKTGHNK